jgi:hypothetical protein
MPRSVLIASATAVALVLSGAAQAGGPGGGFAFGGSGAAAPDGVYRYVTLPGVRGTVVARIRRDNGSVGRYRQLRGAWALPAVLPQVAEGLSRDGRTLVLADAQLAFGGARQASTRFAILDARTLAVRRFIRLPGTFEYDALSPNARTLFLIQYLSLTDSSRYVVRAYDLREHRLLRRAISDKRAWGVTMQGWAMQRTSSRSGRWVYTLYSRGSRPFVHMLDTRTRRAFCVNLPGRRSPRAALSLRLRLERQESSLAVWTVQGKRTVARIDTGTMQRTSA